VLGNDPNVRCYGGLFSDNLALENPTRRFDRYGFSGWYYAVSFTGHQHYSAPVPPAEFATSPFRYFKTSPEIIRLPVMMYARFPLSLRNVEDLLHERGIEISHETVQFWWNRFGPIFAAEIRQKRIGQHRSNSKWKWHLGEVFVKINGETHYL
jgi:putative transposase